MNKKNIIVSGGQGKLAQELKKLSSDNVLCPSRQELDITSVDSIEKYIHANHADFFIHAAAYTRPMSNHQKNPDISISTNIIGTSNVVLVCMKYNIKLIYISTDYVYPGTEGNYKEDSPISPYQINFDGMTKYGWSKIGGECAVRLYDNSLILRVCMCDFPFPHKSALTDVKKSLIYNFEAADIILKTLNERGVINIGGEAQSIYSFASKLNKDLKKIVRSDLDDVTMAPDTTMNIARMKEIINND